LGLSKVAKGLKGYRYQEIEQEQDDIEDPAGNPAVDYDKYKEYINRIVARFYRKLPPNSRWDRDEFTSEAWLALCDCQANYYNPDYNDSLRAFAYPYIIKRLSEFMAVNMYSLKARYYNVKKNEENFAKINWLERTIWTESQTKSAHTDSAGADKYNDNPLNNKPSGIMSMMDEAAKQEELNIIHEIVNEELPKKERRAIVRRFRDGDSYRKIGQRLSVSPETARKLVIRGLEKIKKRAKDAGINSSEDL